MAAGYILRNDHAAMIVLRVPLSLDVPVLDGADDVAFVGSAQLNFHLIPAVGIDVLKKEIEPTSPRLSPLLVLQNEIAQAQDRSVFGDSLLNPFFVQLGMILQPDALVFHELHGSGSLPSAGRCARRRRRHVQVIIDQPVLSLGTRCTKAQLQSGSVPRCTTGFKVAFQFLLATDVPPAPRAGDGPAGGP